MSELVYSSASWRDFLELTKPRVVLLMLLCALVGMLVATPVMPSLDLIACTLLGIALVAASAAVVNHIADSEIDLRMARTRERPIAERRVHPFVAASFGALLGICGMFVLLFLVNPLTAWLNFASWIGYGLIYTLYLKRATSQNIVIGGLFGAAPPLFGWTAVTNSIELGGLILVLIIFLWTPPHFWALALDRRQDYEKVNIPMLPITHGDEHTRKQILYYTLALWAVSLAPTFIGMNGWFYFGSAFVLGALFTALAIALLRKRNHAARSMFRYSIVYLALLFLALFLDHRFF